MGFGALGHFWVSTLESGGGGWTNFVGAILVDDPSFEGPADGNGFARAGWPWFSGGTLSASLDTSDFVTDEPARWLAPAATPAASLT